MNLTQKFSSLLWAAVTLLIAPAIFADMPAPVIRADKVTPSIRAVNPAVAIIIDDLGYRHLEGRRALSLPQAVTLSILPHSPFGREFAEGAHARGMEVMLHLPLQPEDSNEDPGPGGIWLESDITAVSELLEQDLASVPYAVGVNNHMGSMLTRHPGHMTWLMVELDHRKLYFVDSFTSPASIALQMARETGVPAVRRNVFLDADPEESAVEREFDRLLQLARERGFAVAIGHPYPTTMSVLEARLPELERSGVRLIPASQLIKLAAGADE